MAAKVSPALTSTTAGAAGCALAPTTANTTAAAAAPHSARRQPGRRTTRFEPPIKTFLPVEAVVFAAASVQAPPAAALPSFKREGPRRMFKGVERPPRGNRD